MYGLSAFGQRNHAATDAKITSVVGFDKHALPAWAISGPTYDQQPPFRFSTSPYANTSYVGLPDLWQFPWITVSSSK